MKGRHSALFKWGNDYFLLEMTLLSSMEGRLPALVHNETTVTHFSEGQSSFISQTDTPRICVEKGISFCHEEGRVASLLWRQDSALCSRSNSAFFLYVLLAPGKISSNEYLNYCHLC